jgi:hypothetical protein
MTLFGDMSRAKTSIRIDVFHDERILRERGWLYHCMVFVPIDHGDWLIHELTARRNGYDGFVHFAELRNPPAPTPEGMKSFVAKSWIDLFVEDTRNTRRQSHVNNFCAYILEINLNHLNSDCFPKEVDRNVFNRFFRTTLSSGIRQFYGADFRSIQVRHVFHGTRDVGLDNPFTMAPNVAY